MIPVMKGIVLLVVVLLSLSAHRIEARPPDANQVEVAILSKAIVLDRREKTSIRCVLRNITTEDIVLPSWPNVYYQVHATDTDGVPLPSYPAALFELALPKIEDFVVLRPGAELPFTLSINTEKPKEEDFANFKTRRGIAVISDKVTRYLCPSHFYLSVRAYAPDRSATRSVRRKIRERFWEGDLLSARVDVRVK